MSDIFLGYQRGDIDVARKVASALERSGWSVFWDTEIDPGQRWEDVLEDELTKAKCVLVLWSKRSVRSRWVRIEAEFGVEHKKFIPAKIEDVSPPLAFRGVQAAMLVDWGGTVRHGEFEKLVRAITSLAGYPKKSPEHLKKLRKRAKNHLAAAAEEKGFEKSLRSDRIYYHVTDGNLRLVFKDTVVRREERVAKGEKWRLRRSFNLLKEAEVFVRSLG